MNSKFACGEVENPLKLYRGKDCVEGFCDYICNEAHRLYHKFPEKPMKPLTREQWIDHEEKLPATFASKNSSIMISRLEITATIPGDIKDLLIEYFSNAGCAFLHGGHEARGIQHSGTFLCLEGN